MNLSCKPLSQASSERCSMTPPGAAPALLTMMSTRPSTLCPCSMKFFASASLVRSAAMATILRPVAFAISAAVLSRTSARRAQMATSTPSLASASAMPLPIPSLPPVTSAVLPLSRRSICVSRRDEKPGSACGQAIGRFGLRLRTNEIKFKTRSARKMPAADASGSPPEDRLRRVADRLDVLAGIEKRNDPAGRGFKPLVAPGKRANEAALVEHELDIAAEIFRVQQSLLEGPAVEGKDVGGHLAPGFLVHVVEAAEELRRGLAGLPGELRREVGAHGASGCVHGVVARARIHAPPFDFLAQHPVERVEVRTGVIAK